MLLSLLLFVHNRDIDIQNIAIENIAIENIAIESFFMR